MTTNEHRWQGLQAEFDRFIKEETDDRILPAAAKTTSGAGEKLPF